MAIFNIKLLVYQRVMGNVANQLTNPSVVGGSCPPVAGDTRDSSVLGLAWFTTS